MKTTSIIAIVLFFTIIGTIISIVLTIVQAIKTLATDWNDKTLNNDKILWGLLSLMILGPIATLVFGSKIMEAYSGYSPSVKQEINPEVEIKEQKEELELIE